ncbi:TIGR03089 family protein [Dactylosporangium sucinum]|uniref:TIGR03089 family protein n=1 Tax=Dactylosporangium sucinum TaxID=1424081 RepID=A0A917WLS5_9ACTN|nr:TIGR03089 family protein [Dactylosporangium sucinum]GGM12800.1 hypothetical protein GCM10007977_012480 [Dactylosporangium sucinum]
MALPTTVDQPLLTFYDDATGERTELSATALGEWSARAAGLLLHECGVGAGSRVASLLPPHWLTAATLLGAWALGAEVSFQLYATAGLSPADRFDAVFVEQRRVGSWLENIPDAPHRFVLGEADAYRSLEPALRARSAALPNLGRVRPTDAASTDGTTYGEWGRVAEGLAQSLDLHRGDRLLVDAASHEHPMKWLLAPLQAGASVVVCANLDRARLNARVTAERATRVI